MKEPTVSILYRFPGERRSLLPLLTEMQKEAGFLSESAIRDISLHLGLTDNEVYGVASYYPWFRFAPSPEAPPEPSSERSPGATSPSGGAVVVCNAARGEPGDVDRFLLANQPAAIVQGLLREAKRLGFGRAVIWVDAEWPTAAERVTRAAGEAEKGGIVFAVVRVPGAFMHRDEAAFLKAFEGERPIGDRPPGEPRVAVYSAERLVRLAKETRSTALYALGGSVREPGAVQAAADVTVRQLFERAGGIIPTGKTLKAFQAGGPLGKWLPADRLDELAGADSLGASTCGSGSFQFANVDACAVDLAARSLEFLSRNLCGKCAICREGTMQMAEILCDITRGKGKAADLTLLVELGEGLATTGGCALGRAAPNALLSTMQAFRDEFDAHVRRNTCLAGRCGAGREIP
ncbi:MAG: NADH-ubiquinone oxidoreductase-F iron-sulfur binding region domain-containing protein [Deferrisomatales bacterium]|nr:NADH-ubiquinone oxidoreductase-F iron-sulfur binding region domain-containing protein [Deferrisomatales bacterium]